MRTEVESISMKALLKQVYAVHSTKLKSLEDEIEYLKKNLYEAENKLKSGNSECKRCLELEEAFNSCKSALNEQSKLFENLGQKFSTCNPVEKDSVANIPKIKVSTVDYNEPVSSDIDKKINFEAPSKTHLLKNIMSLNTIECQESLNLSCGLINKNVNPDYSSLAVDSLVLAPNTEDVTNIQEKSGNAFHSNSEITSKSTQAHTMSFDAPKQQCNSYLKDRKNKIKDKELVKKRLSNQLSELTSEELIDEKEIKTANTSKKLKISDNHTDYAAQNPIIKQTEKNTTNLKDKKSNNFNPNLSINGIKNNQNTIVLNVKIGKAMHDTKNSLTTDHGIESACPINVSPSLIPVSVKCYENSLDNVSEDINDFQVATVPKKASNEEGSWTSCDKRKIKKKLLNVKPLKTTSRFTMQLDALPPNFKKPAYRQTKLSKSIFQPKPSNADKENSPETTDIKKAFDDFSSDSTSTTSVPVSMINRTVDFDATCIPDNYEYEVISSGNKTSEQSKVNSPNGYEMNERNLIDESEEEDSSELIIEQPTIGKKSKKDCIKNCNDMKNLTPYEIGNSFDRLPKKEEPNYKYKEETVRKKAERKQLTGFDCNDCEKYYAELGLSDEEKQKRMNKCSRHRAKFAPPSTPEHFWELDFPDTQECKARGYLNQTQKGTLKSHRKRPL